MKIDATILRQLDAFTLRARKAVAGLRQGSHRSQRRGHGVEFAEYRSYELGDNPRYIDWNLYARSDKLYIKRYLEEENVALFIIIDASPSMTHPELRIKWQTALTLAVMAGYVALASQDPVSIFTLGGRSSSMFWGGKAFHELQRFAGELSNALSDSPPDIDLCLEARRAAAQTKFPGIGLIISDFLYPLEKTASILAAFRARNMELHAVQLLGPMDIDPDTGSDGATLLCSESNECRAVSLSVESRSEYSALLTNHNKALRDHCLQQGIKFISGIIEDSPEHTALTLLPRMSLFV